MTVIWTNKAVLEFEKNLDYWDNRNKSTTYSEKIRDATKRLQIEIENKPYFLAHYRKGLGLYQRMYFKGKFSIFYDVVEDLNLIIIYRFRSNKQKPLKRRKRT